MTSKVKRIYDRLPLQVAQVLRDAQAWRAHRRNHRDSCAETELRNLQQSVDELDRWEAEQDPDYRASDVAVVVARSTNHNVPKTDLKLVPPLCPTCPVRRRGEYQVDFDKRVRIHRGLEADE